MATRKTSTTRTTKKSTKKKTAKKTPAAKRSSTSTKKKPATKTTKSTKTKAAKKNTTKKSAGDEQVTIDRRRKADRRDEQATAADPIKNTEPKLERRAKVQRRRQIDPTTCERDYSDHEVEFMNAMDDYKRKSGRMFPTCSEVLEVIRDLGYVRLTPAELAAREAGQPAPIIEEQAPLEPNPETAFATAAEAHLVRE